MTDGQDLTVKYYQGGGPLIRHVKKHYPWFFEIDLKTPGPIYVSEENLKPVTQARREDDYEQQPN